MNNPTKRDSAGVHIVLIPANKTIVKRDHYSDRTSSCLNKCEVLDLAY